MKTCSECPAPIPADAPTHTMACPNCRLKRNARLKRERINAARAANPPTRQCAHPNCGTLFPLNRSQKYCGAHQTPEHDRERINARRRARRKQKPTPKPATGETRFATCKHPGCNKAFTFQAQAGRPRRFCDTHSTRRAASQRFRLRHGPRTRPPNNEQARRREWSGGQTATTISMLNPDHPDYNPRIMGKPVNEQLRILARENDPTFTAWFLEGVQDVAGIHELRARILARSSTYQTRGGA